MLQESEKNLPTQKIKSTLTEDKDISQKIESRLIEEEKKGEELINKVRMLLAGVLAIIITISTLKRNGEITTGAVIVYFLVAVIMGYGIILTIYFKKVKNIWRGIKYISIVFEMLMVTGGAFSPQFDPGMSGPAVFLMARNNVYYLFLVLNLLRYNTKTGVIAGALGAIFYGVIAFQHTALMGADFTAVVDGVTYQMHFPVDNEIFRCVFIFMGGVFASWAAGRYRNFLIKGIRAEIINAKTMEALLKNAEEMASVISEQTEIIHGATENSMGLVNLQTEQCEASQKRIVKLLMTTAAINTSSKKQAGEIESISTTIDHLTDSLNTIKMSMEKQKQSVLNTSTAIHQMNASIKSISNNADTLKNHSGSLIEMAKQGGNTVKTLSQAISEVEASSSEIGKMVEVISGISSQTNLLAMNAAIEAAHAGDVGRGFAVVAEEVRNLAESSQQTAEQIKASAKNITERISRGVELADISHQSIETIITKVGETNNLISEISVATSQQEDSTAGIVLTVEELTELSKHVADAAEAQVRDSESISNSLSSLKSMSTGILEEMRKQHSESEELDSSLAKLRDSATETAKGSKDTSEAVDILRTQVTKLLNVFSQK